MRLRILDTRANEGLNTITILPRQVGLRADAYEAMKLGEGMEMALAEDEGVIYIGKKIKDADKPEDLEKTSGFRLSVQKGSKPGGICSCTYEFMKEHPDFKTGVYALSEAISYTGDLGDEWEFWSLIFLKEKMERKREVKAEKPIL